MQNIFSMFRDGFMDIFHLRNISSMFGGGNVDVLRKNSLKITAISGEIPCREENLGELEKKFG
jgi:hypothetical protein